MRAQRSVAAIVVLIAALTVGVSSAASADGEQITLECVGYAPYDTSVDIFATVRVDGALYTGDATLSVTSDPSDESAWVSNTVAVEAGDLYVPLDNWFAAGEIASVSAKLQVGTTTEVCTVDYAPALVDYSGTVSIKAGEKVHLLADLLLSPDLFLAEVMPDVDLQVSTASGWKTVATARATAYGNYALLDYKPSGWVDARLRVRSSASVVVGYSDTFLIDVTHAKATVTSRSTSVVQSKSATVTARIGNHATSGKASLQRKSGSSWVTVSSKSFTQGTATFTWTQSATTTYRVVMTPTGKAASVASSFAVTHVPAVSAKPAATSARKGATVGVTVTHRLTSTGAGKLQYYSGGAWRTYKSFTLAGGGTTKTSLTVKSTLKWRVLVGSHASASFTITAR